MRLKKLETLLGSQWDSFGIKPMVYESKNNPLHTVRALPLQSWSTHVCSVMIEAERYGGRPGPPSCVGKASSQQ